MSYVINALSRVKGISFHNFIETGLEFGKGLDTAKRSGFKNLYSCDLRSDYVTQGKEKFPEATILQCDSLAFLEMVLPGVKGKTFFWLDAHYPKHYKVNADDSDIKIRFPGLYEIQLIKKYKENYQEDWIALDDIMVINDDASPINRSDKFEEYYRVNEYSYTDLLDLLKDTHISNGVLEGTDILLFRPKSLEGLLGKKSI